MNWKSRVLYTVSDVRPAPPEWILWCFWSVFKILFLFYFVQLIQLVHFVGIFSLLESRLEYFFCAKMKFGRKQNDESKKKESFYLILSRSTKTNIQLRIDDYCWGDDNSISNDHLSQLQSSIVNTHLKIAIAANIIRLAKRTTICVQKVLCWMSSNKVN